MNRSPAYPMPAPICLGDTTSHGGTGTSAANHATAVRMPLARVNGHVTRPGQLNEGVKVSAKI